MKALLIVCLALTGCTSTEEIKTESLLALDHKYQAELIKMYASLINVFGKERDFKVERRKSIENTEFLYEDSLGGSISYLKSPFRFTEGQREFILETYASSMYYDKEQQSLTMMLFKFEEDDKRIRLIISDNPDTKAKLKSQKPILVQGNRHYLVINDW